MSDKERQEDLPFDYEAAAKVKKMTGDEAYEAALLGPTAPLNHRWEFGFYRRAGNGRARSLWYAVVRVWRVWRIRRGVE